MNEMNTKERKETATPVIKKTEYAIDGRTGMRMTKAEWLEMRKSEMNY